MPILATTWQVAGRQEAVAAWAGALSIPQSGSFFLAWRLHWEDDWAGRRERTLSFIREAVEAGIFKGPVLNLPPQSLLGGITRSLKVHPS